MAFKQNIHCLIEENINKCIKEELSINTEVVSITKKIIKTIKEKIPTFDKQTFKEGVTINNFSFKYPLENKHITISVKHYNFFSKYYYNIYNNDIDFSCSSICDGDSINFLIINCYSISGALNIEDLSDSVQHEISHIFQGNKGSRNITNNNTLYNNASANLNNKNEDIKNIAYAIYSSFDFEQDGYVNGLYAQLMQLGPVPNWKEVKEKSPAYERLYNSIDVLNKILIPAYESNNIELSNEIKYTFGISIGECIKFISNGNKRFYNKIGKVLIKHRQDLINENKSPIKSIYNPFPYITIF